MNPEQFTVTKVASRNYNVLDENGNPLLDAEGVPLRFLSATAAKAEIEASKADATAEPEVPGSDAEGRQETPAGLNVADAVAEAEALLEARQSNGGADAAVVAVVRQEFAANPKVGVSRLYVACRAAGVKVSRVRMDPAVALVRSELGIGERHLSAVAS